MDVGQGHGNLLHLNLEHPSKDVKYEVGGAYEIPHQFYRRYCCLKSLKNTYFAEIQVDAPARAAWEVYSTLKLAELTEKELPAVIDKIEVVEGDGSAGTILKLVFAPGTPGFSYYKEKFTKVDDETRVKVAEVVEGGYLDVGFNFYRVIFEIIEKDEKSCITKSTIEYDIKEDHAANVSFVSMEPLIAVMKIAANYLTSN